MVGGFDHVEIMFDDDDAVALFHQGVEDFEEFANIFEMEAGGGFIEDVERVAGGAPGEFLGEFDALGFAAGQGGGLLADLDVAEADFEQHGELFADGRHGLEEFDAVFDCHVQHVGDGFALEFHFQGFAVVAVAVADVAGDIDIGQEVHFDLDQAVARAGFAAPAFDVEAEAAGFVAAGQRFRQAGEPIADVGEAAGIGRGVGARGAADGGLIDVDHLVEVVQPIKVIVRGGEHAGAVQFAGGGVVECIDGEGGFAAARHAGDAGEGAQRDAGGDALQIVAAGVLHGEFLARSLAALGRHRDGAAA